MTDILRQDNPDVARFIGSYKYDQEITDRRNKFGGGTSLPLDSDDYEGRQRKLKDELRRDFLDQQEKPSDAVYYRVGTPEQGLRGLGQYENQRNEININRQREYNDFLREKKNVELQRVEARRNRPPPQATHPPAGQVDYDQQNQMARTEDRRAYQDHMGKYHQLNVVQVKPPINYEADRKRLSEERKQDYDQMIEKKAKEERYWKMRGRPVTPQGGGLDIGHYDRHLKQQAPLKKKEYKEYLEQVEKLLHKAWERVAEVSPSHVHYRDVERPLVGSPRDVNFYMHEKKEKDRFGLTNRDFNPYSKSKVSPDKSTLNYQHHVARELSKREDENFTRYLKAEKEKRTNQKAYREDLEKQQKEHMYARARQEPEMPVLDRSAPQHGGYVTSKPPPGPHELPKRQTPNYWNDGKRERSPVSLTSDSSKPSKVVKDNDIPLVNGKESMGTKNRDIPSAFRAAPYSHRQGPEEVQYRESGPFSKEQQGINGYENMERPQASVPMSPQKSYNAPQLPRFMEQQYDDYSDQRRQLGPHKPSINGDEPSYKPSFQGQRSQDRPRQTPLAFQTSSSGRGYQQKEGSLRGPSPRESKEFEKHEKSSKAKDIPPIGGIYVFDDSKHDKIKKTIHDMKKNDYQDYLKKQEDERQRRQEEARQQRGTPAQPMKDHYYSSDEYEKFQRNLHRQEGEEYREFLKKQYEPKWKIGLPLGQYQYEPKRLLMEHERNTEYNYYSKKSFQPPSNAQGLPLGQYNYEPKRLAMEAERNRDYNKLLSKRKPPQQVDGPQGLNIDVNYQAKKRVFLEKQRNKEYNELLQKDEDHQGYKEPTQNQERHENNYGIPPQPHHSPSYDSPFDDRRSQRNLTPHRRSRQEWSTHQQVSSNMHAVLNPTPLAMQRVDSRQKVTTPLRPENAYAKERSYVPEAPDHATDPYRSNPNRFHNQMTAPYPKAASVPADYRDIPATPNKLSLPVGSYDEARQFKEKERNREYNDYVSKLPPIHSGRAGMTPQATSHTLPVGAYDTIRPSLERQRNKEYNHLMQEGKLDKKKGSLREKAVTPPNQQGIFDNQERYIGYAKNMERERNREYNDFLQKKYAKGKMTSRSEPDRSKASFYMGQEEEQEMKKRYLSHERSQQYNQMLREQEPHRSRSVTIPNDVDSGLPIGQQHHEAMRRFLRDQRNTEYNNMMDMPESSSSWSVNIQGQKPLNYLPVGQKYHTAWTNFQLERQRQGLNNSVKKQEVRNRDWQFGNSGALELKGDDENQSKKAVLREERQKDYNEFMSQNLRKFNKSWPEPDGRGALLVKTGEYDNVRNMYSNERKQDLQQYLSQKDSPQTRPLTNERRARSEPAPIGLQDNFNPIVSALGKYTDTRKKFVEDRRKEFKSFIAERKLHDIEPRKVLVETPPTKAGEEKPLVNSMGHYETETRKKFVRERKTDFANFAHEKEKHWTPRHNVKENIMPHVAAAETPLVNFMGHYDDEKHKIRTERNKDLQEFSYKKKQEYHSPYENYVYPLVAVAEKPLVEYMGRDVEQRKTDLRQERRHEYERYQSQQRVKDVPRRHDYLDNRNGPYDGIFSGLGDHGDTKEVLGQQRRREYNERLDHAPHSKAAGRPTWVKETIANSTDRGKSPMRNPPPTDHYQQMLDEKRREEAQRRRHDDPEYQYQSNKMTPGSRDGGRYMGDMQQQRYGGYNPQE